MTGYARGRGRRGGKGRGCGNVEGISDNFPVVSSVDINPSQRPTLDQASQPQAQPIGIPEEMIGFARGRGRRDRKSRGRGNVKGIRELPQGPTIDQASQPQAQPTRIPEASQWTSLELRSPETSQRPSSGSEFSRNLEGSVHPSSENLNSGAVSFSNTKKGRGKYRSIHVDMKTQCGSKITVYIPDDIDRAVGPGARDIVNYCGLIMRSTISFRDGEWAKIFAKHGQTMWLKVQEKFEVGGGRGEHVLQGFVASTMQRLFRTWKTRLHAEYLRYNTDEERLSHPPKDVMPEDWEFLVQYFGSPTFKAVSERNKTNRKKQTTKHSCGSKSFAEVEESTRDPLTGEKAPPDRVWELQHTRKNDKGELLWSDPRSQQIYDQIQELVGQQEYEENESPMNGDEILAIVLGERTGYVRGKGYGKQPLKKSRMQQGDLGSSLSSAIESVRYEMQADMERKLQEEREQMRAEMDKRFQEQMEEERRQMRLEMDKRIQDKMEMAALIVRMQQGQGSSTARVIQRKKQKSTGASWGVKRKR
ncbi:uncharacterized protein LOC107805844 isoform X1 [Nicotiana tabacum]|uniref:Uncharacterized protein LOC107805844 isoform X1 n=3 Tax=Nicotiana TaxID=4085 RepID=A0A1S4B927_TOBAC|nr:PREDICTED: uncharacterized protein LOC104239397 isoform X1 [Nicotiana sylvestris]XP_016485425.1 PREDICTED: uncharacterized protein LOC107805844 isoform X1 [Nicotiana tabacum]